MNLFGYDVHLEQWNTSKHHLDLSSWTLGHEADTDGTHEFWIGPLYIIMSPLMLQSDRDHNVTPFDGDLRNDQGKDRDSPT